MTNHFANVEKVVYPKKADKRTIPLNGLATLAALDKHIESLETLRATLRSKLDEVLIDDCITEGMKKKARPATFYAVDGVAGATCMLKKKAAGTRVADDVAVLLRKHGITVEYKTLVEDLLIFNKDYERDSKIMKRVADKLLNDPLLPKNLILHQVGSTQQVLGDRALDELFQATDRKTIATLLPVLGTVAMDTRTEAKPSEITTLVRQARAA